METIQVWFNDQPTEQFKSYYVVWKPDYLYLRGNCAHAFKSYYVVWKPRRKWFVQGRQFRLNRTM